MNAPVRAAALVLAVSLWGCGGEPRRRASSELPVDVLADAGRSERLHVAPPETTFSPPRAAVWLAQVAPARPAPIDAPLPDPTPGAVEEPIADPLPLEVDPGLKPPIPRGRSTLRVPRGAPRGSVELDVRAGKEVLQLASFGASFFFDTGTAAPPGRPLKLSELKTDVGLGLRVAISRASGNSILRVDAAYALDRDPFGRRGWLFSFSSGQVF